MLSLYFHNSQITKLHIMKLGAAINLKTDASPVAIYKKTRVKSHKIGKVQRKSGIVINDGLI